MPADPVVELGECRFVGARHQCDECFVRQVGVVADAHRRRPPRTGAER